MVLVVAKKWRTCSSLPRSANEQACGSWEGAQTDRQTAELASGNIPSHGPRAACEGGVALSLFPAFKSSLAWEFKSSLAWEFKSSLVREFELYREFGLFQEFRKIRARRVPRSLLGDWQRIGHQAVRKLYCI